MQTIVVDKMIGAPISDVFDAFVDHERLADLPVVLSARVDVPGVTEKNGLGAVRVVNGGVITLREEVTAFERPHLMEYAIRRSRPALEHTLGRVEFTEVAGVTRVVWTSAFELNNRILRVVEPAFAAGFHLVFVTVLRQTAKRAKALPR